MPRPVLISARTRSGLACIAVALVLGASTAACSTSGPGQEATSSARPVLTPVPTETLLPDGGGDEHSAVGELADGFPSDVLPVPEGAQMLLSSAEPVAGTDLTAISLNLRTTQDAAGLLAAVRGPLVAAGFAEGAPPVPEPGLAVQSTFSRGDGAELVVVGILDRDGERTLTLGGRIRSTAP
ncbi:hypothetical protein [Cellulomonas fengjieae]|uniref:hypothetical protein n=1 Tax=Cellulomonas fengjieae TaxID=2819978 RepID=UPI001AAF3C44|nr:hypothetical protein [Cellulomonas fengjieae]MBO3103597.1 hypothetical protein [Cellulomonas fengjieae]